MTPQFQIGQEVHTPEGDGEIVHFFPAPKKPECATYTVRLPGRPHAVPFKTHEISATKEPS